MDLRQCSYKTLRAFVVKKLIYKILIHVTNLGPGHSVSLVAQSSQRNSIGPLSENSVSSVLSVAKIIYLF